jgi:hypothetical protein
VLLLLLLRMRARGGATPQAHDAVNTASQQAAIGKAKERCGRASTPT